MQARMLAVRDVVAGRRDARFVLQPVVDIQQGRVVGYEALARLGQRLTTSPSSWFTAARHTAQLLDLEAVLVRQALTLRDSLPPGRFLALNVSPQLLVEPSVLHVLAGAGDLSTVVIELTEHARFPDGGALNPALQGLRAQGARLALDDVGAGWAGLKQVADLRPDIVKLDRSLVADADRDEVKQALAEMMLSLCGRLGSSLLVEGVETLGELDLFARMGVPHAQGFVFGRPERSPVRIDEDLAVRLKFRAGLNRHADKIAAYVDVTGAVVGPGTPAPPEPAGSAGPVVVVDAQGVPRELRLPAAAPVAVTRVLASEDMRSVLRRAMTRPLSQRFHPLVCVDRAGRYVGLVAVESLVLALSSQDATATTATTATPATAVRTLVLP
jgi:EAL domain-containing protein (putative c-di-GMP-specific phosphodiesterase class I)